MRKQIFENIDGKLRLLVTPEECRDITFNVAIDDNLIPNVLFNGIKSNSSLEYKGKVYTLNISVNEGICSISLSIDGAVKDRWKCNSFRSFSSVQMDIWFKYDITLISFITLNNIVDDDFINEYVNIWYYPPITVGRTEWDYIAPETKNIGGGWYSVSYNEDGSFTTAKC